jgi:hypothetical protein
VSNRLRFCPECGQEYSINGSCRCDDDYIQEIDQEQGRRDEAIAWAKLYLPDGWYQHPWRITEESYGVLIRDGKPAEQYNMACIVRKPDGWYAVVICEPLDRSSHYNFAPQDETVPAGPFSTEREAVETANRLFALLQERMQTLPPVPPKGYGRLKGTS